ncbi:DUF3857 domain-containing protein [Mucilaginibacter terrenus]|uniref:DUF3857 domain-containing protein n=1 Tax=Mucilaginibacter terrenus TaxID=2482727 RepID=A0A3E2NWJ2_9SPHI|nr:DUF3857 domain-containing protein [Mucilaginibacter terrenus]RFZ85291.1 DUF3857 domain-containing protein [Mucilaginibacter terrenus]
MNKFLPGLFILLLAGVGASAQNFPYGTFSQEELAAKKYVKDTSAHAYVISEYGTSRIDVTSDDNIKVIHDYHVKIKILDSKAFDKGTVEVSYYTKGDNPESVEDIEGVTTYIDENGSAKQSVLDRSQVYRSKENVYYSKAKFAMPNVKAGSIIEYKYRLVSPYIYQFPSWQFQDDIPKMVSTYEVHIPAFWNYNASLRGRLKLTTNTAEVEKTCFSTHGASCDCSHITYGMADIPAFIEEDYMTAPKNFVSAIYYELSDYTNPYTNQKVKVTKDWKDIDYNLKKADYFGAQIRKKDLLKKYIDPVIEGKADDLAKAKAVYAYIQKNIKWNNVRARGSEDGIRKALESHTGSVGDINLALVAALGSAGLNAEAVMLSTRTNGLINKLYPVEDEFDYVVAKLNIGDKSYMLDASDPLLSFDMLPLKCLNDQGRVMSLDKPSYWVDLTARQPKRSTSSYELTLQSNGKMKGTVTNYSIGYEAYEKRKAIRKFNTTDEYVENLDERLAKVKILNSQISNLDSLDLPVVEKYEVEIDAFNSVNGGRLAFNPFFFDRIAVNPFKLQDRAYPVDWGMPSDERFVLNMTLPTEYVVESAPQPNAISLPNSGGKFMTDFNSDGNRFTFSNVVQFSKSVYESEEYPYLKEFYNKMIAAEKAEIVFRKK